MNVNLQTLAQMERLAPRTLDFRGRVYSWNPASGDHPVLVDGDRSEIRVSYVTPKREDEFVHSKVSIQVRYLRGQDLYRMRIVAYDGETLASDDLGEIDLYVDGFSMIDRWVRLAEDESARRRA